jgi:hypothetical protein
MEERSMTGVVRLVLGLGLVCATASNTLAQSCLGLPLQNGELWVSATGSPGPEELLYELGGSFNAADRLVAQVAVGVGGYDVEGVGSLTIARVAGMAHAGPITVCLWGLAGGLEYSFRDRFGMFQGNVEERVLGLGLEVAGRLMGRGTLWLEWSAAAGVANEAEAVAGRRLVVEPTQIYEESVRRVEYAWPVLLDFGLAARLRRVGVGLHLADRAAFSDGLVLRVEVGLMAVRLTG